MSHPNNPKVDQSDRVIPYQLRQSGRTPVNFSYQPVLGNLLSGISQSKRDAGEQRPITGSIIREVT